MLTELCPLILPSISAIELGGAASCIVTTATARLPSEISLPRVPTSSTSPFLSPQLLSATETYTHAVSKLISPIASFKSDPLSSLTSSYGSQQALLLQSQHTKTRLKLYWVRDFAQADTVTSVPCATKKLTTHVSSSWTNTHPQLETSMSHLTTNVFSLSAEALTSSYMSSFSTNLRRSSRIWLFMEEHL